VRHTAQCVVLRETAAVLRKVSPHLCLALCASAAAVAAAAVAAVAAAVAGAAKAERAVESGTRTKPSVHAPARSGITHR
jgi:hypothetical protein